MERETLRSHCDAYVLGLLDGEELRELEALINKGDPETKTALRESIDLVAQIALTSNPADPPALLRPKIMNALPKPAEAPPQRKRNVLSFAGWAVAAGLALVAFLGYQSANMYSSRLARAEGELREARQEAAGLRAESRLMKRVMAIVMARDTRLIRLASAEPERPQFRAFWSQPTGLVLTGVNVTAPQSGRTMQLWVVPKAGNPVSAGVFQPAADGQVVHIPESLTAAIEGSAALAISDEPEGGSPQPTTKPVWVGAIGD
ncbi:MAG: anti-sigma factor [Acidobacteria bacterium]|nr:anti-sigma factor [Acidobacteriota bacterium]